MLSELTRQQLEALCRTMAMPQPREGKGDTKLRDYALISVGRDLERRYGLNKSEIARVLAGLPDTPSASSIRTALY